MKQFEHEADLHWAWVRRLLILFVDVVGYLYKTSMVHGYKHGIEDAARRAEMRPFQQTYRPTLDDED